MVCIPRSRSWCLFLGFLILAGYVLYLVCYVLVLPEDVSDVCVSVFTVMVADVHSDEGEQRTLRVLTLGYLVLPEKFICL